ncbi:50S ribosomal protein L19e [Candidatus Woesearchaeota archaeon]|nr:MAG: 50S ribosomal protein L19e [Candidatus Woesearchaeota archaeon]
MKLKLQKRLAAALLNCSPKRVRFDPAQVNDIKEGITKSDMRLLITDKLVSKRPEKGVSRVRARKTRAQKRKGLRRGHGSKKGTPNANHPQKERWMSKVRVQRAFLKELKEKGRIALTTYRLLYRKAKGGYFRSKRHIKLYIDDQRLWKE